MNRHAHDHYVKGLYHWRKLTTDGWEAAAVWFRRSIAIDASFAPAFAGLACVTYALAGLKGVMSIGEYLSARNATRRALQLDADLADAHAVDARLKWSPEWDIPGADVAFLRSLSLNPSSSEVRYAIYLIVVGRSEEGLRRAEIARGCDPVRANAQFRLALTCYVARRYGDAIAILVDVLDLEPRFNPALVYLGCAYAAAGQTEKAVELLRKGASDGNPTVIAELAWACSTASRRRCTGGAHTMRGR